MKKIVLVGFGGHARSVADIIERNGLYKIVGYTDMQKAEADNGYDYLGTDDELVNIFKSGVNAAVITVGQIGPDSIRHRLYEKLKLIGYELPVIVDPSAIISENTIIEEGCVVGKGAIINSNAAIGKCSIINTGALCEHDVKIGEFCHVAVRGVCCGMVTVGNNTLIGANATIIQCVSIGENVVIGAGSTVIHDVTAGEVRYGIV